MKRNNLGVSRSRSFARSVALLSSSAALAACASAVSPDGATPADVALESGHDALVTDGPSTDARVGDVVDAGPGCPATRPLSGQACSSSLTCDYSGGRCETVENVLCRCAADPSGNLRWNCGPNCDIGPLAPPELAA